MVNQKLAKIFYEMAEFLEMEDVAFKPRAYQKAAHSLEGLARDAEEIYNRGGLKALEKIAGVGKGIAQRIEEYLKTGKIKDYENLKKKIPVDINELTAIEGVGPKLVKLFYKSLKIRNIDQLEKAARSGSLASLPRVGEKLQQKILNGIEFYKKSHKRFLLGAIYPLAREIEKRLRKLKGVKEVAISGSFRRRKETIGDLDILVSSSSAKVVADYFVSMPGVEHVYGRGLKKSMVRLRGGLDADLRVVKAGSFGSALQYFTGNKAHNIKLRKIAIKKGYKLNEYGLFKEGRRIGGRTEKEIYKKLGLQFIAPELRRDEGEIELALRGRLPKLVESEDIKGDLQLQTNWTDGSSSIKDYVKEAEKLGYEYIMITDHTKSLAMTGGLDEETLMRQMREIDKINAECEASNIKCRVLKGAEVNILKDGSLDIRDDILRKLDIVAGAIHSHFRLSRREQTQRLLKAMRNPNLDIVFHPTTRIIQKRPELDLEMDEVLRVAAETGTILEINAFPDRLDLRDEYIAKGKRFGVKFVIDTDAHSVNHLHFMKFGLWQARRGGCEKDDIVNTMALSELLSLFSKRKNERF
jgi:DNA polymerase (family 10)